MLVGAAAAFTQPTGLDHDPALNITFITRIRGIILCRGLNLVGFGHAIAIEYFVFVYRTFRGKVALTSGQTDTKNELFRGDIGCSKPNILPCGLSLQ